MVSGEPQNIPTAAVKTAKDNARGGRRRRFSGWPSTKRYIAGRQLPGFTALLTNMQQVREKGAGRPAGFAIKEKERRIRISFHRSSLNNITRSNEIYVHPPVYDRQAGCCHKFHHSVLYWNRKTEV